MNYYLHTLVEAHLSALEVQSKTPLRRFLLYSLGFHDRMDSFWKEVEKKVEGVRHKCLALFPSIKNSNLYGFIDFIHGVLLVLAGNIMVNRKFVIFLSD